MSYYCGQGAAYPKGTFQHAAYPNGVKQGIAYPNGVGNLSIYNNCKIHDIAYGDVCFSVDAANDPIYLLDEAANQLFGEAGEALLDG